MQVAAPLGPHPFVTIAIPCLNEIRFIDQCVEDALAQDYPPDRIEVIVADGGSTDGTRARLDELCAKHATLSWVPNPERLQAAGLNAIIRAARGDVIVRMDAHCEYAGNYVSQCIEVLRQTGALNAGGSQRAVARNHFQKALCAALQSRLGVGGADYRSPTAEGFVDTVFCGAFRREAFERAGLFDPAAATNEDAELNQRILESGGQIYLSPKIVSRYFPRESFRRLARQYFAYGQGRARTLLKRGRFPRLRPAIPFLMTTSGAALLLTAPLAPTTLLAFGSYLCVTGIEALRLGLPVGAWAPPLVWAIFPTLHVSHGVGFGVGLVRYALRPDWPSSPEYLAPREVGAPA